MHAEIVDLATFDVVLLRQDPPFDMSYITTTHLLEHIHPKTLVVNDPASVRNAPEKLFVTHFDNVMPPTLITADARSLREFCEEHGDIILKPLFGNGGPGVFRVRPDDENFASLLEMFSQRSREPMIAQRYLPEVRKGDKRIILIDGKAAGVVNRVPAEGEARSNMHVGGKAVKDDAHQARPGDVRHHRAGARAARHDLRRHRRDRRLSHRDQRHLADRPAADQPLRRRLPRGADMGPHRGPLSGNTGRDRGSKEKTHDPPQRSWRLTLACAAAPAWAQFDTMTQKPIVAAVRSGDEEKVRQALLKGENPNQIDPAAGRC